MYSPGHVGIALLCVTPLAAGLCLAGHRRAARVSVLGFLLTASAPDVDLYLAGVPHRGITHTLVAAGVVGLLFGIVAVLTRSPSLSTRVADFVFGCLVGILGLSTHLLGDVVTPMGIQPFAPLVDAHYTLNLVYASDPTANAGLFVAGLVAYGLSTEVTRILAPSPTSTDSTTPLREADPDLS
jgi:inner membrane protein